MFSNGDHSASKVGNFSLWEEPFQGNRIRCGYEQQHTADSTTCNNLVCFRHKGATEYLEIMNSNEKTKHKKPQVLSRDEAAMNSPVQLFHSSSSNGEPF